MSLATQLIKRVLEEKKKTAQDEMGVPKYDNFDTPDNHVKGKPGTKPVSNPAAGLGDRKDKKPTANVGSAHKEKGRDMEGTKTKPKKVTEQSVGRHPAMKALGINISNGLLQFHHPGNPDKIYTIEYGPESHQFVVRTMARHQDVSTVFDMLLDYAESGAGYDPRNTAIGENRGKMAEALGEPDDGKFLIVWKGEVIDSFDDKDEAEAMVSEYNMAFGDGARVARNRNWKSSTKMGEAPDQDPYPFHKDRQQAQMGRQTMGPQGSTNVRSNVGAGIKSQFGGGNVGRTTMDLRNRVGESAHKTADGEMDKGAYSTAKNDPARTAKTRTNQNDEPVNKGNPGTPKKGEKRASQGGHMDPNPTTVKDFKGGENEHKSMKKMHETVQSLESLLGRKLHFEMKLNQYVDKSDKKRFNKHMSGTMKAR